MWMLNVLVRKPYKKPWQQLDQYQLLLMQAISALASTKAEYSKANFVVRFSLITEFWLLDMEQKKRKIIGL